MLQTITAALGVLSIQRNACKSGVVTQAGNFLSPQILGCQKFVRKFASTWNW